ncbi:glycosyltransferase [Vibrio navarrensis]|nr:glycosyltransferase [Vibrio navarrensis]
MNTLFFYPWSGFTPSFMHKDVGLFPSYYAVNQHVTMLIKGRGENFTFRNIRGEYYSNFYFIGLFLFIQKLLFGRFSSVIFFHVGLKNLIPIIFIRLFKRKCKVICKADLNIQTALYLISDSHSLVDRIKLFFYRLIFKNLDVLLVETSDVYNVLSEHFTTLKINRLELMPNGLDGKEFCNITKSIKKENIITVITRFESEKKAPERLFDIIKNISLPGDWKISLIGQLPHDISEKIEKECNNPNLIIENLGYLERENLLSHLSKSSIFICFSREESFCISLIEAAALDNFIVTTNIGVAKDLNEIYNRITVFDDFEPSVFANEICLLARQKNSTSMNQEVMDFYKWENIISRANI